MNGVCVKWEGWIDLETLCGKARLLFDEEQAKVSRQEDNDKNNSDSKQQQTINCYKQ